MASPTRRAIAAGRGMAEQAGTRLGHYRLIAPIGSGGFATVYRAFDERLDSDVAVKILAENHALDIEIRERFLSEAQLLRRVACEAVVPVYDVGETERSQPYIVLAFADRGDLKERVAERLAAGHQVSRQDLVTVADTLAAALGRAHRLGLVHRDVKPTNLLIASTRGEAQGRPLGESGLLAHEERLLLGDLGLAKDLAASSGLTVGGGTHGFNAPEQRAGVGRVDVRTDVYGASAVLFWIATRFIPSDDPVVRSETLDGSGLSGGTASAIQRGLAADPSDRFDDIEQWFRAVAGESSAPARSGVPLGAAAPLDDPAGVDRKAKETSLRSRRPGSGVTMVGLVLVVAVVVAWLALVVPPSDGRSFVELDDGRVQVVERADELTVAVSGPQRVGVGEQAVFEASASGASSFRWFTPDGSVSDANPLILTSSGPGDGRVTLVAADADGRTATVEFEFTVAGAAGDAAG